MKPSLVGLLAALLLVSACTSPALKLAPGTSATAARAQLGPPTGEWALPDGRQQWEYATGPFGRQTHILSFDPQGHLLGAEQVLTERHFNLITVGMTAEEVRQRIGRPSTIWPLPRQKQNVWSYRYDAASCQWFMIGMGYDHRVIDTAYGPDPLCDVNDNAIDVALRHH